MKAALPARVQVSKEAVEFMRECAAEFIEFLTNEGLFNPLIRATVVHLTN